MKITQITVESESASDFNVTQWGHDGDVFCVQHSNIDIELYFTEETALELVEAIRTLKKQNAQPNA